MRKPSVPTRIRRYLSPGVRPLVLVLAVLCPACGARTPLGLFGADEESAGGTSAEHDEPTGREAPPGRRASARRGRVGPSPRGSMDASGPMGMGNRSGDGGAGGASSAAGSGGAGENAGSGGTDGGQDAAGPGSGGDAGIDAEATDGEGGIPLDTTLLALGAFHSCAASGNGRLRCWGTGGYIGQGSTETIGDDETPDAVDDVDIGGRVVQVAASWWHTCSVFDTGKVRCFGTGLTGALGYGNTEDIGDDETPAVAGDVNVGGNVRQVALGPFHTCACLENGRVRCWGRNEHFQLGHSSPETIGDDEHPASAGDVDIGGFVVQVAAGSDHTCALLDTGAVRCWGRGAGGLLGYGNTEDIGDDETPAAAGDVDVGGRVTQIVAGGHHTCALLEGGTVRCWGWNNNSAGPLGYGNAEAIGDDETPASAGDIDVGGRVTELAGGTFGTCALLEGGTVRCWGLGIQGQLGYGNTDTIGDDETPASAGDVSVGGPVTHIDMGFYHTCAILEGGGVRCWGRGSTGALGYGNTNAIGDDELPATAGDVRIW